MEEHEIRDWIEKGYLQVRVIIELLGAPKEHIEEVMEQYIAKIEETEHIKIISKSVAEPKEQQVQSPYNPHETTQMWSNFCELEFMIKGVSKVIGFCFDYMPASIEVIAPEKMQFTNNTTSDFINDLQGKLHRMDTILKQYNSELQFLKQNMHKTILNLISISLSHKSLNKEELTKLTGIPTEGLEAFLELLKKQNIIREENSKYSLIPQ